MIFRNLIISATLLLGIAFFASLAGPRAVHYSYAQEQAAPAGAPAGEHGTAPVGAPPTAAQGNTALPNPLQDDEDHKPVQEPPVRPDQKPPQKPIPKYFTPPPPFTEGVFPCTQCHASMPPNVEVRTLTYHTDIELKHSPDMWCFSCHDPKNRDMLRLASGKTIPFDESYYLCGQCHGPTFRDWKVGVHGKRTGEWNGKKVYRLCVHCHTPHSPRYKSTAPLPVPLKPGNITEVEKTIGIDVEGTKLYIPVYKK